MQPGQHHCCSATDQATCQTREQGLTWGSQCWDRGTWQETSQRRMDTVQVQVWSREAGTRQTEVEWGNLRPCPRCRVLLSPDPGLETRILPLDWGWDHNCRLQQSQQLQRTCLVCQAGDCNPVLLELCTGQGWRSCPSDLSWTRLQTWPGCWCTRCTRYHQCTG